MGETVGDTETILPGEVPEGEFQSVTVGKKFSLPAISAKSKSWELPAELVEFLQERCNSYLSDKELEEFLKTNTPANVKGATKLDPFLKTLLDKKDLNRTISTDQTTNNKKSIRNCIKLWNHYLRRGKLFKKL